MGLVKVDLDRVVPKLAHWRLSTIPRHLPWDQVRELIDSVDTSKRGGLRDKAVLLLIATLGLRRKEVCDLQLDDIAWRAGEIGLTKTKSRRERSLPPNAGSRCGPRRLYTSRASAPFPSPVGPQQPRSRGTHHPSRDWRHRNKTLATHGNPCLKLRCPSAPPQPRNPFGQSGCPYQANRRSPRTRQHQHHRDLHQGGYLETGHRRSTVSRE